MNVYKVVSECLTDGGWGYTPPESYFIAEMVAAPTRDRARWLAWKADPSSRSDWYDIRNMPRFEVRLIQRDFPIDEGVLSGEWTEFWTEIDRPYAHPYVALVEDYLGLAYEYQYEESPV